MGLFDDLMYPDNKNRASRAAELGNDCATITAQLMQDKGAVDALLTGATQAIQAAYQNIAQTAIPVASVDLGNSWVATVAAVISPIVAMERTMVALQAAGKAWLLSEGRIGEAAFADLVGLPRWLSVGKVIGGVAAAVAVEAIVDAADGAANRDKLRDAINDLLPPRITLKQDSLLNEQVKTTLSSVIAAYNALKNVPGISKDQLDAIVANLLAQNQVNVNAITTDYAKTQLQQLDAARGSWTNEG